MADPKSDPFLDLYVEPCSDCMNGDHNFCIGRTIDHALDEYVPCPCRSAGHQMTQEPTRD